MTDTPSIAAREAAASPGPWTVDEPTQQGVPIRMPPIRQFTPGRPGGKDARTVCVVMGYGRDYEAPNAAFIAHARTDIPFLLGEVSRLTAALATARAEGFEAGKEAAAKGFYALAPKEGRFSAFVFEPGIGQDDDGPWVLRSEVERAIRALKRGDQ